MKNAAKGVRVGAGAVRATPDVAEAPKLAPNGEAYDVRFLCSTELVAEDLGVIKADGWRTTRFMQRPRFIENHNLWAEGGRPLRELALGRVVHVGVEPGFDPALAGRSGKGLVAYVRFAHTDYAQDIKRLYDDGVLDDVSVRWDPNTAKTRTPTTAERGEYGERCGWIADEADLMEISAVLMGADAGAQKVRAYCESARAAGKPLAALEQRLDAPAVRMVDQAAVADAMSELEKVGAALALVTETVGQIGQQFGDVVASLSALVAVGNQVEDVEELDEPADEPAADDEAADEPAAEPAADEPAADADALAKAEADALAAEEAKADAGAADAEAAASEEDEEKKKRAASAADEATRAVPQAPVTAGVQAAFDVPGGAGELLRTGAWPSTLIEAAEFEKAAASLLSALDVVVRGEVAKQGGSDDEQWRRCSAVFSAPQAMLGDALGAQVELAQFVCSTACFAADAQWRDAGAISDYTYPKSQWNSSALDRISRAQDAALAAWLAGATEFAKKQAAAGGAPAAPAVNEDDANAPARSGEPFMRIALSGVVDTRKSATEDGQQPFARIALARVG